MRAVVLGIVSLCLLASTGTAAQMYGHLETEQLPPHLRDRGEGIPTSMFGTYVQKGQFLVYPFFEYYRDDNLEYAPDEFGHTEDSDYRGKYEAFEGILFVSYGFTDKLAIELEGAYINATLEKSPDDPSGMPDKLEESGVGDVEGQIRYRWNRERVDLPEFFSYLEAVGPTQDEGSLIGTSEWELKLGSGVIRGFSWGTMTARVAVEYAVDSEDFALGEAAVEYLRRLSSHWRVYGGVEGTQDEVGVVAEVQYHFSRHAFAKVNSGFGVTSKATDWAPEVGVLFSF